MMANVIITIAPTAIAVYQIVKNPSALSIIISLNYFFKGKNKSYPPQKTLVELMQVLSLVKLVALEFAPKDR
jgi:hypothetical protein